MNTSEHCSSGLERWLSDAVANLLACPPTVIVRRAAGTGVVDFTGSHISKADLSAASLFNLHFAG